MNNEIHLHCPDCGHNAVLPPQRCPVCGDVMRTGAPKRTMSPIIVILLLAFVLGPFGFGMLWRSNRFSVAWKIALTVATLAWTIFLLWGAYAAVNAVLDALMGAGGGGGDLEKALQQLQNT